MAYENTAGIGVNNHYGVRTTGNAVGVETSDNSVHLLTIQFTGESLNETFLPPVFLSGVSKDFSGVSLVTSAKVLATLCLWPGVTGLIFLTAILIKCCCKSL